MYECKFEEALEIIAVLEKEKKDSLEKQIPLQILRGRIFCYKEQYKKAIEVGEHIYQLSQKMGRISETIEALLIKAHIVYLGKLEKGFDLILEAEKLLNITVNEPTSDFLRQKVDFLRIKSIIYRIADDLNRALELALQWIDLHEKVGEKLDIACVYRHLGEIYLYKSELDTGLNYAMKSLDIQKKLDNKVGIATSLHLAALIHYSKGNFDQALEFSKQSMASKEISIFTKLGILHILGGIYREKGELDRTIRYYNRAVALAEKENYIEKYIINILGLATIYRTKGNYDLAVEFFKRSLTLSSNIKSLYGMCASLFYLILLNLEKNSYKQAQSYLLQLEKLANQTGSRAFTQAYLIAKALVLKKSSRIRNRTEAEILLKQIAEEEIAIPQLYLLSLVNLCDLFLEELYITNNSEILNELNPLIDKILSIAENQHAYLWLAETKLLQAKLALIQMNIKKAKQLLTQAQQIAEIHGLNALAIKISNEHDNLLEQLNIWDNFKKEKAPISERIKLASFGGIIDLMQGKRVIEPPELTHETPVLLLIIGEGGFPLFSNPFTKGWSFKNNLISGFLTAFDSFSGEIFAKRLDRAKFGEFTILFITTELISQNCSAF